MTTLAEVRDAAMQLSEQEREALALELMDTLDKEPGYDEYWEAEIARRIADVEAGRSTPIPWEEVRRQLYDGLDGQPEG